MKVGFTFHVLGKEERSLKEKLQRKRESLQVLGKGQVSKDEQGGVGNEGRPV